MRSFLLVLAYSLVVQSAWSQSPTLVMDIGTTPTDLGKPSGLIVFNGQLYFSKYSLEHGEELWRSDGTTTELFADIFPGSSSSSPASFAVFNGELYFGAKSPQSFNGPYFDLWKTDGVSTTLVKPNVNPSQLVVTNTSIFFNGYETSTAYELWKSDGTTDGTTLVKNIASSNSPSGIRELTAVGDNVFFGATLDPFSNTPSYELWFSDGTEIGTIMLDASPSSTASNPLNLKEFAGKLYFTALSSDGMNKSLYSSDGTVPGTTVVTTLMGFGATNPVIYKTPSALYYWDNNFGSKRLYSFDGTTSTLLKTFDNSIFNVTFRANFEDILFLNGPTTGGASATNYKVDGGVVTTSLVVPGSEGVTLNGLYYYQNGSKLFSTDGSDASITELESLTNVFMLPPKELIVLGSDIFFLATDNDEHTQLWKTDGTIGSAERITEKGFLSNTGASPTTLTVLGNQLYFNTSGHVFKTDGTEVNTTVAIASNSIKEGGVELNGEYYFSAGNNFTDKLMKTDGTTITEVFGMDRRIMNLTVADNKIFFTSTTNSEETELWVTDGTIGNKTMLDLASGGTFSSYPTQLTNVEETLYFTAVDMATGTRGLWRTDGTLVGSEVVDSDVGYSISEFRHLGDYLYYVTDEVLTGTELKSYNIQTSDFHSFDMNPGTADANPQKLTIFNNKLYFFAAVVYPQALCSVSEIADPEVILPVTTQVISEVGVGHNFISFYQSHFSEITHYKVDADGTVTTPTNSYLNTFYTTASVPTKWIVGQLTYFISDGGLVETDGTDEGTRLVLSPLGMKQDQSSVAEAAMFNNELYFVYDNGLLGKELYKYKSALQDFSLTASSDFVFEQINSNELSVAWTNGSGDGRLLLASANTPTGLPKNIAYTSNSIFGESALEVGATTFVVDNTSGATSAITGLTPGTNYHFTLVEYTEDTPGNFRYDRQRALRGSFTMEKQDQTITAEDVSKTFGDAAFVLEASASSGLAVTYSYVSGPAQLVGTTLTITGAGEIVIAVTQPGNDQYNAAPAEEMVITVAKADWPIVFPTIVPDLVYSPDIDIDLTFYDNVAYEIIEGTATIGGGTSSGFFDIRMVTAGTITIQATRTGNDDYNETTAELTFNVAKADQLISYTEQVDTDYLSASTTLTATSDSGLPVSFAIVNGPVTLSGNLLTFTGVGTVEITVSQPGNVNYNPAETIEDSFVISPSDQIITFDVPQEIPYSTQSFPIVVNTNSGQAAVVSILSGKGTLIGANPQYQFSTDDDATGTVTLEAVVGTGGGLFNLATEQFTFTVVKGENVISFDPSDITYSANTVQLTATTGSGLPISFSQVGGTGEVTFLGNEMNIVTAGTIEVTATQSGNTNWNAATSVTRTFTILKADQFITFNQDNITYTPDPISLTGFSNSGLPLIYEKTEGTAVVTLTENLMNITSAGTVELTATQPGNANWNAAQAQIRTFTIAKATQTIDFAELAGITKATPSVSLTASSSSGLAVSFSSQTGRTAVTGNIATVQSISSGSETITASQSGNDNYEAATSVSRSFCISPMAPTVSASGLETGSAQLQTNNTLDGIDWYKNGVFLQSQPANSPLTITDEGIYKALAKANDACPSSDFSNEITLMVTDLEQSIHSALVYLYPNPTANELTVLLGEFELNKEVSISIHDVLGRIQETRISKGVTSQKFDVRHYAEGSYLVRMQQGTRAISSQFVKQVP